MVKLAYGHAAGTLELLLLRMLLSLPLPIGIPDHLERDGADRNFSGKDIFMVAGPRIFGMIPFQLF